MLHKKGLIIKTTKYTNKRNGVYSLLSLNIKKNVRPLGL